MDPRKKKILIISGIAAAIILILVILVLIANREYRQDSVNAWQQVIHQSKAAAEKAKSVNNEDTAREFTSDLDQLNTVVSIEKSTVEKLNSESPFYVFKNTKLEEVLVSYDAYLKVLVTVTKSPTDFSDKETQNLSQLSQELQDKSNQLISKTFISDQIPNEILILPQKMVQIRDDYLKAQELEQQKRSAEAAAASQVSNNITKFLNAYLAQDKDGVKRYMTDAYEKEFDFHRFDYPDTNVKSKDFRILDITRVSDSEYRASVVLNYVYQYPSSTDEYRSSNSYDLRVILDSKYNAWLVDRMDYK